MAGQTERLAGDIFGDAGDLKHDTAGLNNGNPILRGALTGTHTGLSRLLSDGLIGEDLDPDHGYKEEVYGFDIPVPAIDEEFDVALIGKKNKWYDHKVKVTNPQKEADAEASDTKETDTKKATAEDLKLEDGDYTADVKLEGGSGKATVTSPAEFTVKDGKVTASVEWSSPYYDYMLIGDDKYEPVNKDGNSVFEIPVDGFDYPMEVTADTVAMSTPHEIEYTLQFDSASIKEAEK